MNIRTSNNSEFSYLRSTNEIVSGIVDEPSFVWEFAPLETFSKLPNLDMFIIGITEQCNLRCTYCCYSGSYEGNRTHSSKSMSTEDIDQTLCFIRENAKGDKLHIAFYGGEPLVNYEVFQYAIAKAEEIWQEAVSFSVTTNGTLLDEERIDGSLVIMLSCTCLLMEPRHFMISTELMQQETARTLRFISH